MILLLQVVEFNKQLMEHIIELENQCSSLCQKLQEKFFKDFQKVHVQLTVDVIRNLKGKKADQKNIFDENYESFIEIGLEEEEDYYPNTYIPIWKCKKEMFHQIGYLTKTDMVTIENKIIHILQEMLEDRKEDLKHT